MIKVNHYQKLPLVFSEVNKVFTLNGQGVWDKKALLEESGLGDNKIRSIKEFIRDFSLIQPKQSGLSDLGKLILRFDKYFEDEFTLWILIYNWSKPENNSFLYYILNEIEVDNHSEQQLLDYFKAWLINNKVEVSHDTAKYLVKCTLNTLLDNRAFKTLNLMLYEKENYRIGNPYKLQTLFVAYILYDNQNGRTTISFEELLHEHGNIGKLLNLNREALQKQIYAMRDIGLVQYVQTANLQHVVFTYKQGPIKLLERYYEQY